LLKKNREFLEKRGFEIEEKNSDITIKITRRSLPGGINVAFIDTDELNIIAETGRITKVIYDDDVLTLEVKNVSKP
jgi:hypothetical protein